MNCVPVCSDRFLIKRVFYLQLPEKIAGQHRSSRHISGAGLLACLVQDAIKKLTLSVFLLVTVLAKAFQFATVIVPIHAALYISFVVHIQCHLIRAAVLALKTSRLHHLEALLLPIRVLDLLCKSG